MTQRLKDAIDALASLEDLPEEEQKSIATGVIELVESAKSHGAKTAQWGPAWQGLSAEERCKDFRAWMERFTDGPGLPDEALRRENIYK